MSNGYQWAGDQNWEERKATRVILDFKNVLIRIGVMKRSGLKRDFTGKTRVPGIYYTTKVVMK